MTLHTHCIRIAYALHTHCIRTAYALHTHIHTYTRTKASLARDLLALNVSFFFADVDVVLLRDPLPYLRLQLQAGADLLFHTDGFGPSAHALAYPDSLEQPKHG